MQQKKRGYAEVERIFGLGQIALAIVWFALHTSYVRENASEEYFVAMLYNNSKSDYTGYLYPVFLLFFQHISSLGKEFAAGAYACLAAMQSAALFFGIRFFLIQSGIAGGERKKNGSREALVCLTFPPVLQSGATVSPVAFAVSLLLVFWGCLFQTNRGRRNGIKLAVLLIGLLLLHIPEFCIAGIGWFLILIKRSFGYKKNGKKLLRGWLCFGAAMFCGLMLSVSPISKQDRLYTGAETGFMLGVTFENVAEDYYCWPEEIRQMIPEEELRAAGGDRRTFLGLLDTAMEAADKTPMEKRQIIFRIGLASVTNRTKEILSLWGKQFWENIASPITFVCNLYGKGLSNTTWHLVDFYGNYWFAGEVYLLWGYAFLLYSALVKFLGYAGALYKKDNTALTRAGKIIFFVIALTALYNALFSGSHFDYLMCIPIYVAIRGSMLAGGGIPLQKAQNYSDDNCK